MSKGSHTHYDPLGDSFGWGRGVTWTKDSTSDHGRWAEQTGSNTADGNIDQFFSAPLISKAATIQSHSWVTPERQATYLESGYWRETGQTPHSFDTASSNVITVNLTGLSAAGKDLARAGLDAWEMVADLNFREVTGRADITYDDTRSGATTNVSFTMSGDMVGAGVNIGSDWIATYGKTVGSYSFHTYLHETGHALGLGHAGNYAASADGNFDNDSWQMSVMSYNSQVENENVDASYAQVASAMMADIIAIQSIYGAPKGGATAGNTTYGVGSELGNYLDDFFAGKSGGLAGNALTIFDEGGTDTINFRDDTTRQVVDMAGGTYSDVYGLTGNFAIAKGTMIESYVAGSNSDAITGNAAGNSIKGMAGDDRVLGEGGTDTLLGGSGNDVIFGGDGRDVLSGDSGNDRAFGEAGDDRLNGMAQNDILDGGTGDDVLDGGDGADTLRGSDGADRLNGGAGSDILAGGAGHDILSGGTGQDVFIYTAGRDTIVGFDNNIDTLRLDDMLWQGRDLSLDQVLNMARVADGDIVFDFGDGNQLTIQNMTSLDALSNDLRII